MSNIPIFSYKDYLDKTVRLKDNGHIGADRQAEAPVSAGARGLRKTKAFIDEPVHMMGEDTEPVRPGPANPNPSSAQEDAVDIDKNFQIDLMKYLNMKMVQIEKQIQDKPAKTPEEQEDKDFAVKLFKFVQQKLAQQDAKNESRKMTESEMVITKQDFPKMISNLITVPQTGIGKKEFDPRLLSKIYQALTGEPVDYDIAKGTYTVHKKTQTK